MIKNGQYSEIAAKNDKVARNGSSYSETMPLTLNDVTTKVMKMNKCKVKSETRMGNKKILSTQKKAWNLSLRTWVIRFRRVKVRYCRV